MLEAKRAVKYRSPPAQCHANVAGHSTWEVDDLHTHLVASVSQVLPFFFSSRRRHTRSDREWSSDVCSSDLDECLASIEAEAPREIIVVDGNSTDGTLEIARRHSATILCDGGRGLPAARMLG